MRLLTVFALGVCCLSALTAASWMLWDGWIGEGRRLGMQAPALVLGGTDLFLGIVAAGFAVWLSRPGKQS